MDLILCRVFIDKTDNSMPIHNIDYAINVWDKERVLSYVLFNYIKSIHILNLYSFLTSTRIFGNHFGYLTFQIKFILSKHVISFLTNLFFSSDSRSYFCFTKGSLGQNLACDCPPKEEYLNINICQWKNECYVYKK